MVDEVDAPQANDGDDDEADDLFRDLDEDDPVGPGDVDAAHKPSACAALASEQPTGKANSRDGSPTCKGSPCRSCVARP